jgi:membrane protein
MSSFGELLKQAYADWTEDEAARLGASLAYYTVLSIAPLLIVLIAVIGLVYGQEAARGQIVQEMSSVVGSEAAKSLEDIINNAQQPATGTIATILGLITLVFGASGVVAELQASLNKIWEVKAPPVSGILGMARQRIFSFGMVLAIGFVLLVSLVLSAAVAGAGKFLGGVLPIPEAVLQAANLGLSFLVITTLFALIYKYLPDVRIAWNDVWRGAAATALLFVIGKFLLGLYLGKAGIGSAYGAAGSLVVLLVWVYYSAQIFFFGAEFTQVYANRYGSRIVAEKGAEPQEPRKQTVLPPPLPPRPARHPVPAAAQISSAKPPGKFAAVGGLAIAAGVLGARFWNRVNGGVQAATPSRPPQRMKK